MAFRDGEGVCTKLLLFMYLLTLRLNKRPYFTGYIYPFSKCRYQTVVATMYALRLSEYSCIYVNADVEEQAFGTVTVSSWRGLGKWAWLSSVGLVVASFSKPRKPGRMFFFCYHWRCCLVWPRQPHRKLRVYRPIYTGFRHGWWSIVLRIWWCGVYPLCDFRNWCFELFGQCILLIS